MADRVNFEGQGTHEAVALELLKLLFNVERFENRQQILDAYVECRSATYGNRPDIARR